MKERAKAIVPFLVAAAAYTQLVHLPLEQILNGAIAAVLFNIIYDTLLSRKLRWFAMCPVIDSMNHQSTSTVCPIPDVYHTNLRPRIENVLRAVERAQL